MKVKNSLTVAALSGVLMLLPVSSLAHAEDVTLTGNWQVKTDKGTTVLRLSQSGDSVAGKWVPAKGDPAEIENGKIAGDTVTFSFVYNTHHLNATGHLSGDTISLDIVGHKWGMSKKVHRTATRME